MRDKNERQQALLEAVRAELVQHEHSEYSLPATNELYRGFPYYKGDLETDAVLWLNSHAFPRLKGAKGISKALTALHRLHDNVCADFAADAARAAQLLLRDGGLAPGVDLVMDDVYQRCSYFGWQLGHQYLAPDVAVCAYQLAARSRETLHIVRFWQTAVTALAASMTPGPRGDRDRNRGRDRALTRIVGWGHYAKEVAQASKAAGAEDKEKVRDHIEGQFRRLAGLDNVEIEPAGLDDVDAFMVEPALPKRPAPTGPSLVVIQSLDHLPERKHDRSAPRSEYGDLAGRALPLVRTPDLAEAAATLKCEFPWLATVIDRVLEPLVGREAVIFPSGILLVGKVGAGKSELARRITDVLGLPRTEVPMGGMADSSYGGTSRQWSTGRASLVTQTLKRTGVANPAIVLDEIDKASLNRFNGSALDVVLSQVDPGLRKAWFDPFLETGIDISAVTFIATANDVQNLRGPLLDRCLLQFCGDPGPADAEAIVTGILRRTREASGLDPRFIPDLDSTEWAVLKRGWRGGSIRPLKRAVDRLLTLRSTPGLAH
jgi:hypothetical protein